MTSTSGARVRSPRRTRPPRGRVLAAAAALSLLLSGCSLINDLSAAEPTPTAAATPSASPTPYPSQFTRDGTYQSHIKRGGLDFVYTLYPTKATPRTNEWFPRGDKFFSFTFQAYDLDRPLRAKFRTKRKVWLDTIKVTSMTRTSGPNAAPGEQPYYLSDEARRITFDPEPQANRYGMLITSPKGAFELRNQKIGTVDLSTIGLDLTFEATVYVERRAGSNTYRREVIRDVVPISIFPSDQVTEVADIPINAN